MRNRFCRSANVRSTLYCVYTSVQHIVDNCAEEKMRLLLRTLSSRARSTQRIGFMSQRCHVMSHETINILQLEMTPERMDGTGWMDGWIMMSYLNSAHKQNNWIHSNGAIFCWLLFSPLARFQTDTQRSPHSLASLLVSLSFFFTSHV